MANATNASSSQVATLYGHVYSKPRWSEFESRSDEADKLEARMASMDIIHRVSGKWGSWYACSRFLQALLYLCLTVPLPFVLALLFPDMKITCPEGINSELLLRAHDEPSY